MTKATRMLLEGRIKLIQEDLFEVVLYFTGGHLMHVERFAGPLEACKQWIKEKCKND
jgi:hypothetical protein